MGAPMNGPDYVQWDGFYEVAKIFYSDFLPEAEHLLPGVTPAVKESSYHQWLKISEGFKGRHGVKLNQPDWSDRAHRIAFSAELAKEDILMFAIFNAYWEPLDSSFHVHRAKGMP